MNGKTKAILTVLIAVVVSAIVLGMLLFPIVADGKDTGKEEQTTETTEKAPAQNTEAESAEKADPHGAPDFSVYDMDGRKTALSDKKGKPVVLNFWASWCPPCVGELPHFEEMYKKYSGKVDFMMINLTDGYDETKEKVEGFIDTNGYTFPVYLDSDINAVVAYKISSIPLTVFVDAEGKIVNSKVGAMDAATLEGYIKKLIGEN